MKPHIMISLHDKQSAVWKQSLGMFLGQEVVMFLKSISSKNVLVTSRQGFTGLMKTDHSQLKLMTNPDEIIYKERNPLSSLPPIIKPAH